MAEAQVPPVVDVIVPAAATLATQIVTLVTTNQPTLAWAQVEQAFDRARHQIRLRAHTTPLNPA